MFFICTNASALMELSGEFGYQKQKYGDGKASKITDRTYSGSLAWYMFSTTALEFNYSQSERFQIENNTIHYRTADVSIISMQNNIQTEQFGVGLRQLLSSPKSRFRPMISLGYAKQYITERTEVTFRYNPTGETLAVQDNVEDREEDAVFGAFSLQIQLTKMFALKGTVKTVIPAFAWDEAGDYISYTAGFTWLF